MVRLLIDYANTNNIMLELKNNNKFICLNNGELLKNEIKYIYIYIYI